MIYLNKSWQISLEELWHRHQYFDYKNPIVQENFGILHTGGKFLVFKFENGNSKIILQQLSEGFDDEGTEGFGARTELIFLTRINDPTEEFETELKKFDTASPSDSFEIVVSTRFRKIRSSNNFSNSFLEELIKYEEDLSNKAYQCISLIMWRLNANGNLSIFAEEQAMGLGLLKYSFTGESWKSFPIVYYIDSLDFDTGEPFYKKPSVPSIAELKSIEDLLDENGDKRFIGQSIFYEAWQLRRSNPKVALVMAVAAAETGFKEYVADLMPETEWLLENIQSPPLIKMLREFMELIPTRETIHGKVLRPPKNIITLIQTGVEHRNKMVHTGKLELSIDKLLPILNAIKDLLWILDYYRGNSWAIQYLQKSTFDDLFKE
jgi:hypothetical protein